MKDLKIDINQFSIRYMDDLNKKKYSWMSPNI